MSHYKSPNNAIHFLGDDNFAHLLPAGCIQITAAEAESIRVASIPAPTRDQLISKIDALRDKEMDAGFMHNGALYHCDPMFQAQVQGFVLAYTVGVLAPTATVSIRRKDNTTGLLNQQQIGALAGALMAHVRSPFRQQPERGQPHLVRFKDMAGRHLLQCQVWDMGRPGRT